MLLPVGSSRHRRSTRRGVAKPLGSRWSTDGGSQCCLRTRRLPQLPWRFSLIRPSHALASIGACVVSYCWSVYLCRGALMGFDNLIQVATLTTVAIALIISLSQNRQLIRQTREMARQTGEIARQTRITVATIELSSYQSMIAGDGTLAQLAIGSAEMIRWHLAACGYPVGSDFSNKRALFAIMRLNAHEGNFLAHLAGNLNDDIWIPWSRVLKRDLAIPEYRAIWPNARSFFATSFVDYVDSVMSDQIDLPMPSPEHTGTVLRTKQISALISRVIRLGSRQARRTAVSADPSPDR
jgi:low affinity Fe/Cu permease